MVGPSVKPERAPAASCATATPGAKSVAIDTRRPVKRMEEVSDPATASKIATTDRAERPMPARGLQRRINHIGSDDTCFPELFNPTALSLLCVSARGAVKIARPIPAHPASPPATR